MNWDWDKLQEKRQRQGWSYQTGKGDGDGGDSRPSGEGPPKGSGPSPRDLLPGFLNRSGGLKYTILAIVVVWLLSGIYIVNPDEQGVVLRFGKFDRIVEAGPHYHIPVPIESVARPKVTQVQRVEVGFPSAGANRAFQQQGQTRTGLEEAAMLTGDENIVNIQFSVQFQIKDAVQYLYNVDNQHAVVKNAAEAAMREVIGNSLIDSALTDGKIEIQNDATQLLQEILDRYKMGVRVIAVQMQDVHPPKEVSEAFKDVASAREDKIRIINEADAYRNELLPKARGVAAEIINQAEAYRETRVRNAEGETQRFLAILAEYEAAKSVTARRMYLETMEEILGNPDLGKIIISKSAAGGTLPLLSLDRLVKTGAQSGGRD
jgi:membrane protease subunit HflK